MPRTSPRSSRAPQPVSISLPTVAEYVVELGQQGNLQALSELMEIARHAWMVACEQSPQRTFPLDSEVLHALGHLPQPTQEMVSEMLSRVFTNGSISYTRKGNRWYVVDKVVGTTKSLRRWARDFLRAEVTSVGTSLAA